MSTFHHSIVVVLMAAFEFLDKNIKKWQSLVCANRLAQCTFGVIYECFFICMRHTNVVIAPVFDRVQVAERVAAERGERCGDASAGYQIRLEW